jgi:hypothetical protein
MKASSVSRSVWHGRRTALVISHPGHELLVHGWLEQARPTVFVLTSGKGAGDKQDIATTATIVQRAGARIGSFFGRASNRGLHHSLLLGEKERFNAIAQELADAFLSESIDFVAGDAAEGVDPAHDLCRLLIDTAVGIAAALRPNVKNYEFSLIGDIAARSSTLNQYVAGDAWVRKFTSCRSYAKPIEEIQRHIANDGLDSLRKECLRLATPWAIQHRRNVLYAHAENGRLPAIHFRDHFLPVAASMQRFVMRGHTRAA